MSKKTIKVQDVLVRAAEIISDEPSWTKGRLAGLRVETGAVFYATIDNEHANCFCALGAVQKAARELVPELPGVEAAAMAQESKREKLERDTESALVKALPTRFQAKESIPFFNDREMTTHRQIKNLFKRAIAAL